MHTPHPPRPPYAPGPGAAAGESDESLAAQLRGRPEGEAAHPVALLMARHWQSAHDYAVICLASSANVASMVTAASFHQVIDHLGQGDTGAAVRPDLLVAVRDTVRRWSAEERISGVLPDLRKPAGGRGMRAAKSMTAENRKLTERSFHALPGLARCLLWHTEVEAEHISVPAGLSGMDPDAASVALEGAREQFREALVRSHRELAPTKECRFNNRLLDVPIRRGGALLPDVQQHLLDCRYCRSAAEQLSHFEGGLGVLLADAVLGWGARRYLESRPGRARQGMRPRGGGPFTGKRSRGGGRSGGSGRPGGGGHASGGGRHRLLAQIPAPGRRTPPGERHAKALLTGAGLVSAGLLVTILAASLWSEDDGGADPTASTGASSTRTLAPPAGSGTPPAVSSSPPASKGVPTALEQTRLRDLAADLCMDIRGGKAKSGAGTKLAVCSSAWTQQWSLGDDGLLRSIADPELCLDSHEDDGVVVLRRCVGEKNAHAQDVRYDLTVRGELLPRRKEGLALAPTSTDPGSDIVVKVRDGSDAQRWQTDFSSIGRESLSIAGTAQPSSHPVSDPPPAPGTTDLPDAQGTAAPAPAASNTPEENPPETYQERRVVTVDDEARPAPVLPLPVRLPDLPTGVGL
ncbi:RICIN domain-containing protein [Streptomyces sp. SAS_270]|uniref:RICIN domain-containing protein n=1 Tax=Streptomyces sp. SAS_270 TaxID=3412748 RepID=UPI00403C15E7